MCQSTTGTAPWLNRLVNKHHTHTGRELCCGSCCCWWWGSQPQFWTKAPFYASLSTPASSSTIARPNLQLHKSSSRLTAPHTVALSLSCFLVHISFSSSLPHTLCICLTLSPGSAQRQQHHRSGGDSSGGKTEGFFLSSPGVSPPLPSPVLHTRSLPCLSSSGVETTQMFQTTSKQSGCDEHICTQSAG